MTTHLPGRSTPAADHATADIEARLIASVLAAAQPLTAAERHEVFGLLRANGASQRASAA